MVTAIPAAAATGIGGNRPPFDLSLALDPDMLRADLGEQFDHKARRRDELLAGVSRFHDATADGIDNAETQAKAGDFVRQIKQEAKQVEGLRTTAKAPVLDAGKVIDAFFKAITSPLDVAAAGIEKKMTTYARAEADRKRREAEEAAKAAAEKAARAAEEAARKADAEALHAAVAREQEALEAGAAAQTAKPADFSRTYGDLGSVSSLTERWTFALENLARVPLQYLVLNDQAVRQAIRDGARDIPGLRIFRDDKVVVR